MNLKPTFSLKYTKQSSFSTSYQNPIEFLNKKKYFFLLKWRNDTENVTRINSYKLIYSDHILYATIIEKTILFIINY